MQGRKKSKPNPLGSDKRSRAVRHELERVQGETGGVDHGSREDELRWLYQDSYEKMVRDGRIPGPEGNLDAVQNVQMQANEDNHDTAQNNATRGNSCSQQQKIDA